MKQPFVLVLFGSTGDLAKRKLFPAIFALHQDGLLNERFAVIGLGRSEMEQGEFQERLRKSIKEYSRLPIPNDSEWQEFASHFTYKSVDVHDVSAYAELRKEMESIEQRRGTAGNRLFYLSIGPDLFGAVSKNLKEAGLTETTGWKRLVIEKPFGHDYESAMELNEQIKASFSESEIFRIDHYLGKEMIQNIEVIRFANPMFEPLWNRHYIDNVQITSSETVGVEERAGYYDKSGALRDMLQNHMLQMVMMVGMEPPSRLNMEAIRDEKVKVLRSLRTYSENEVATNIVRGQYTAGTLKGKTVPGYREEPGVDPESRTETFVAAKFYIDNFRWAGVPFYIRTGKRLPQKTVEIVIQFKEMPNLFFNREGNLASNLLRIRISPVEGMQLLLNANLPGENKTITPIAMEYCNNCDEESREAYERLIQDAVEGDSTYFTRWDEVALAWKKVDPIQHAWANDTSQLPTYPAGSWGPEEQARIFDDAHHWWPVGDDDEVQVVQAVEKPFAAVGR